MNKELIEKYNNNQNKENRDKLLIEIMSSGDYKDPTSISNEYFDMLGMPIIKPTESYFDKYIESTYNIDNKYLSWPQREVVNYFHSNDNAKALVNAPTSFGKTLLTMYLIKNKRYKRVAYIVPTIFLMNEIYDKLFELREKGEIEDYEISLFPHEKDSLNKRFIDVLTPERFNESENDYDFVVYDEFYKVNNNASKLSDDKRGNSFRVAYKKLRDNFKSYILLTPWLKINADNDWYENLESKWNTKIFDYVKKNPLTNVVNNIEYYDEQEDFFKFVRENEDGLTLLFAKSYTVVKKYINFIKESEFEDIDKEESDLIINLFHEKSSARTSDFAFLIRKGVIVLGSTLPRFLLIELNKIINKEGSKVRFLISTSIISEGVNLPIKTIIIDELNDNIDHFSLLNLAGRAGRFNPKKPIFGKVLINQKYRDLPDKEFILDDLSSSGENNETKDNDLKSPEQKKTEEIINKSLVEFGFLDKSRNISMFSSVKRKKIYEMIIKFKGLSESEKKEIRRIYSEMKNVGVWSGKDDFKWNLEKIQEINEIFKFAIKKDGNLLKFDYYATTLTKGIYASKLSSLKNVEKSKWLDGLMYDFAPKWHIIEKIINYKNEGKANNFANYCSTFSTNSRQLLANDYNLPKSSIQYFADKNGGKKTKLKNEFENKYVNKIKDELGDEK